ncbi:MAG: YncE family protein [Acidobacteriota bacterium]
MGNQPVALAVSSDGSTAYVANYGDSTITRVNLLTGTPTATAAVGGQPTSAALTSAGVL